MGIAKSAIKAITTPKMRDEIKKAMFKIYTSLFFSGRHRLDHTLPFGVNLIGHIRGDFGLGESCRLVAGALEYSGISFSVLNLPMNGPAGESNTDWADRETKEYPYGINLIHLNPNELANGIWKLKPAMLRSRYNIAYWLWELPEFPSEWQYTFKLFDEIWTPAEFISSSLRKCTHKPVYTMPYGLPVPKTDVQYDREYFGLPKDQYLFLLSYDGNSVSARKNPEGSIRAYRRAFSKDDAGVGLVIKATHEKTEGLKQMEELLAGYPNVFVLTDSYTKVEFNSLIKCVDTYSSLHRAEGFGLVMAEAMLLGTPTIATNWSANTEFMNENVACMVDAEVVALTEECPPYHKGYHWAQPDEKAASQWMRRLYEDGGYREGLAIRAKEHIATNFSIQASADKITTRLNEIKKEIEG